jgi:hypothetical protein
MFRMRVTTRGRGDIGRGVTEAMWSGIASPIRDEALLCWPRHASRTGLSVDLERDP